MELDQYQQAVVDSDSQHIRVLAGAGSGKTRAVIARIKRLVDSGVDGGRILPITFSKKAATELQARLEHIPGVAASTLHSLGFRMLQTRGKRGVANDARKRQFAREICNILRPEMSMKKIPGEISRAKRIYCELDFKRIYCLYEELKSQARLVDFDDMLGLAVEALNGDREFRTNWQRWDHVIVDETQDTDTIQWLMIFQLLRPDTSLCVVGDLAQSIYGWRGAQPIELMEGLDQRFPDLETLTLPCNYRSIPRVVELANAVAKDQKGGLNLIGAREGEGTVEWNQPADEALEVVDAIKTNVEAGAGYKDHVILYRTNAQAERFENELIRASIPYEIAGGFSFYSRVEIQDMLAYLRLSQGWDREAAERVANKPTRYIGAAYCREVRDQGGWNADLRRMNFARQSAGRGHRDFLDAVGRLQVMAMDGRSVRALLEFVFNDIGYKKFLKVDEGDQDDNVKAENVEMLLEAADKQGTAASLLLLAKRCQSRVSRAKQASLVDDRNKVQLMTVHRAKGLEWQHVFFVGVDVDVVPHKNAEDVEEEARIFYVAVTRARDTLRITSNQQVSAFVRYFNGEERPNVSDEWPDEGNAEGVPDHAPNREMEYGDEDDGDLVGFSGDDTPGGCPTPS